jgi:15-cis-phytoene synthase
MDAAFAHCEALVRESDKDRFLATLFAPAPFRPPLFALYAFNAEVARVREVAREPMPGEIRLQWWRDVIAGTAAGPAHANPVADALLDTVARYRLTAQVLLDLVEARAFDLYNDPIASLAELEGYTIKTSTALIVLAARILNNGDDPGIDALACHAGLADAMARLLAAFARHASRGQLYLPLDVLARHGARPEDAISGKVTTELRAALAEMRLHARHHLAEARSLIPTAPPAVMPALLPMALARPLLDRMERRDYDPMQPLMLPPWRKQWILWRAARRANVLG